MYTISLIYNKIFLQNPKIKFYLINLFISLLLLYILKPLYINNIELNLRIYNLLPKESTLNLIKLYNYPLNLINLIIINYLFFLLIVVVKITNFFYGPIRIKF